MTVSSINDRAAEEYFRRGQDSENQGQHEKALEFYERALNENPDHESACFRLAVLYDRRAEDAKAIELYDRICTSPPVHINALLNLALLYGFATFMGMLLGMILDQYLARGMGAEREDRLGCRGLG